MKRLLLIEAILTCLVFIILFLGIDCKRITTYFELALARIAKRRILTVLGITALAVAIRVVALGFFPAPQPRIHDEFSYLLAADTFASGRLSNPTHPHWEFFESFHINQIPTYASMYPPAQGLVLAVGMKMGNAWLGVLISTAIMCGTLCWMLQGWLPARWALLAGLIAVVRISLFSYWGNSYWGGGVAAISGLLVLGAIPRLLKENASIVYFLIFGFGILILANSRPYEGLLLCLSIVLAGLTLSLASKVRIGRLVTVKWLAVALILLVGFVAMGFYNWRVTGHPMLMPYEVNQQQYAIAHAFLWQAPTPTVAYRHIVIQKFHMHFYSLAMQARGSMRGFLKLTGIKISKTWLFFVGPILTISLLALRRTIFDRRIRLLILTGIFAVPGILAETWFHAHYVAPFTGIFYVVMLQGLRHVRFSRALSHRLRYALFLTVPTVIILMIAIAFATFPKPVQDRDFGMWCCNGNGESDRSRFIKQLQANGGKHLVFVEYSSTYEPAESDEWVYNSADIDSSPVVFAHYMDSSKNSELIQYFADRQVWHLVVGD